jgi:hypothetical protein
MTKHFKKLSVFILMLMCPPVLRAGIHNIGIERQVLDSSKPLPGAAIIAVHVPSGTQYATIADKAGNYRIQNMRVEVPTR